MLCFAVAVAHAHEPFSGGAHSAISPCFAVCTRAHSARAYTQSRSACAYTHHVLFLLLTAPASRRRDSPSSARRTAHAPDHNGVGAEYRTCRLLPGRCPLATAAAVTARGLRWRRSVWRWLWRRRRVRRVRRRVRLAWRRRWRRTIRGALGGAQSARRARRGPLLPTAACRWRRRRRRELRPKPSTGRLGLRSCMQGPVGGGSRRADAQRRRAGIGRRGGLGDLER